MLRRVGSSMGAAALALLVVAAWTTTPVGAQSPGSTTSTSLAAGGATATTTVASNTPDGSTTTSTTPPSTSTSTLPAPTSTTTADPLSRSAPLAALTTAMTAYRTAVAASGPTLHWPLNETSGLVAADVTAAARDGVLGASAGLGVASPAPLGTGITGPVSRVAVPVSSAGPVSLEFWSRGDGTPGSEGWLARLGNLGLYRLQVSNGCCRGSALAFMGFPPGWDGTFYGDRMVFIGGASDEAATVWRHYVLTHDGTTARLFIDGELRLSLVKLLDLSASPQLSVGEQTGRAFDEVAVYPKLLTVAEIRKHYSLGLTGVACKSTTSTYGAGVVADGATGFWSLNDTDRVARDAVGCRNGAYRLSSAPGPTGTFTGDASADVAPGMTATVGSVAAPVSLEFWSKGDGSVGSEGWLARYGNLGLYRLSVTNGCCRGNALALMGVPVGWNATFYPDRMLFFSGTADEGSTQWRHYVLTHDGTKAELFIDGVLRLSVAVPLDLSDGKLVVGAQTPRQFDDVALYSKVLTATEMARHLASGLAGVGCASAPSGYGALVAADGGVGLWRLGDQDRLARTAIGCRHGAYRTGATQVPGVFSSDNGASVVPSMAVNVDSVVPATGPVSLEFWSKGDGSPGSEGWLARVGNLGLYRLSITNGCCRGNAVALMGPPPGWDYTWYPDRMLFLGGPNDPGAAVWRHYVLTHDGTTATLYIDGVVALSFNQALDLSDRSLVVGEQGPRVFDEVALYPSALSPSTVADHFGAPGRYNAPTTPAVSSRQASLHVNASGAIAKPTGLSFADPVNTANGSFNEEMNDLSQSGRGVSLSLLRTYDSKNGISGPMGVGWGHVYDESLIVDPGSGAATWSAGTGAQVVFLSNGSGGFVSPAGILAKIRVGGTGQRELVSQDQVVHRFDAGGKLVALEDRSDQGLAFAYDATSRVSTITDSSGRVTTMAYGTTGAATGRLVKVTGSDARTVKYSYVVAGVKVLLSSSTDTRAKITTYAYDANGFLASVVDPLLHTEVANIYDPSGRVVSQNDQLGNPTTFVWDDAAEKVTITDAAGAVHVHDYAGRVLGSTTGPAGSTTTSYSPALDTTGFTDQAGQVWAATYDAVGNMVTRTAPAPLSYLESWTYDGFNNPLTYTDRRGITTTYTYDPSGRVLTESRPGPGGPSTTTNVWNPNGTLASTTDPRGALTTYAYDGNGNMSSSTDAIGATTTYTYDTAGRLLSAVDPRGNVAGANPALFTMKYTYDPDGHVLTSTNRQGYRTTNAYDAVGNLSSSTAPDGGVTTYGYNAANERVSMTAPDGGVTTYEYSVRGEQTKQTDPTGGVTTYHFDGAGRMDSMVEPRGNAAGGTPTDFTVRYVYDALGRRTSQTDALGRVTSYSYDVLGRAVTVTDPQGTSTSTYDPNGNVLSMDRSGIGTSSSTYDSLNRVITATDPRGKASTSAYDVGGNLVSSTTPLGFVTTYAYDAVGRRTSMVDARGNVAGANPADFTLSYEYDIAGNQIGVSNQLGQKTVTTYTANSNPYQVTDPKGNRTTFNYDTLDRVKSVAAPSQGTTAYAYNTAGRMVARTDSKAHVTTYQYDLAGRLIKQTDPLGRFWTSAYDVAGNKTLTVNAVANAGGNAALGSTAVTFDRLNRRTLVDYSDATPDVAYAYDAIGHLATMSDGAGAETYGYDSAGRMTSVARGAETFTYTYDANANVTSRVYPDGTSVAYGFDDDNRLTTVVTGGLSTGYGYDAAGNALSTVLPNGVTRTVAYDRAGRIASLMSATGVGPIAAYTYTRDANGQPTVIAATGSNVAGTRLFTYDTGNRLTSVCYSVGTCASAQKTVWAYDTVGNRTSEKVGLGVAVTSTYDNADQLISSVQGAVVTAAYGYDANGNQTSAGTRVSVYNAAMQTVSVQDGTNVATTYTYDGNNNRRSAVGATSTNFSWDINGGLAQLATETNGGGLLRRYVYGLEPISVTTPSATSFYLTDELNSVTHLTGSAGATQWAYTYSPFGSTKTAVQVDAGVAGSPIKFTGQYEDSTGNYNLRARLYNPTLGTFTQTDPLEATVGEPYPSSYVYGRNNPVVYTDPSGLRAERVGPGGEVPVAENPVADQAPDQLALILLQSGAQLPAKGCLPGDSLGMFVDTKWGPFGMRKTVRKVHLCGGVHKNKKGDYGLAHINAQGHFGGKLGTSLYAQGLVASTEEDGAHGDYKGGGLVTNWNLPFQCRTPDFKKVVFIFNVTVSADPGDRIITAFIAKDDHLDKMDPVRMDKSCQAGKYPT